MRMNTKEFPRLNWKLFNLNNRSLSPARQFSRSIAPLAASLASARVTTCAFEWRVVGDRVGTGVLLQLPLLTALVLVLLLVAPVEKIINIGLILIIIVVLIPLDVFPRVIWASWSLGGLVGIELSQKIHGAFVGGVLVVVVGLVGDPSGVVGVPFLLRVLVIFILLLEILPILLLIAQVLFLRQLSLLHVVVDLVFHQIWFLLFWPILHFLLPILSIIDILLVILIPLRV